MAWLSEFPEGLHQRLDLKNMIKSLNQIIIDKNCDPFLDQIGPSSIKNGKENGGSQHSMIIKVSSRKRTRRFLVADRIRYPADQDGLNLPPCSAEAAAG